METEQFEGMESWKEARDLMKHMTIEKLKIELTPGLKVKSAPKASPELFEERVSKQINNVPEGVSGE